MQFGVLICCLIFLLGPVAGRAETLRVGNREVHQTISSAIASAENGDTILVESGTYAENVLIDKSVRIEGINRPLLMGTGKDSVVTVAANDSAVIGFRIERSGSDLQGEDAGILLRSDGNIVEDNELSDVLYGIYLLHSSRNFIRRNTIVGRVDLESGERGAGLHLWNSPSNTLEDNIISYARDGMYIQSSSNNVIRRNRVSHLRYGLHYMNSDNNSFEENLFYNNIAGAAIMYSQRIVLRRNAFVHNRGFSSFGILFQDCRECVAEENLILDNAVGVFLEALKHSVFRRNTIAENDVAMQIFSSSEKNTLTQNNFINNFSPLQLVGRTSSAQWQSEDGGNYWSDYDGYDMDGDGVGDVPHRIHNIFEYLEGNFPRLRIFLNSPAAQSVAAAERSFPILKGSNEYDRRPLMRPVNINMSFSAQDTGGNGRSLLLAVSCLLLGSSVFVLKRGFG